MIISSRQIPTAIPILPKQRSIRCEIRTVDTTWVKLLAIKIEIKIRCGLFSHDAKRFLYFATDT